MSYPEEKRKVMGRIDLASEASSSARFSSTMSRSPPKTVNGMRKGAHVRAKVDMSAFGSPSPHSQSNLGTSEVATPPQNQQYFNRPLRPVSTSYPNSPFLSPGVSPALSSSPALNARSNALASTSSLSPSPHTPKVLRSTSPVRQLQRNTPSSHDVNSPALNGPVRVPRDRVPSGGPVRVNSSQVSSVAGSEVNGRGHLRTNTNSSASSFANGNNTVRGRGDFANSITSSPAAIARSRSPSPNQLKNRKLDRRPSQSSTTSSTVSATSRQAATIPPVRAQRSSNTNSRPTLNTTWSPYSSHNSPTEVTSPSAASPSISSTIAKLPPFREPSLGDSSSSAISVQTPLLSPSLELDAEAQEAKKNRKILDLEITNKSLLAINSGLEVVKLRHAREIQELKKRLRDGRGLGSSLGMEGDGEGEEGEEGELGEDSETLEEEGTLDIELEMAHTRCKNLIDGMVLQAREAILYKYDMDHHSKKTNRVLHPAEVEMMDGQIGEEVEEVAAQPVIQADSSTDDEGDDS